MSSATVDRYEQVLAEDPASPAFVELAQACLDAGELARAVEVCEQGLGHHPRSVVGRVLWGKALIAQGRAAEAMRQFDQAMAVDRADPGAYTLIAEALLRQRLYRSAVPILRKAVALQPGDARLARWLEETRATLAGGPPPVLEGAGAAGGPPSAGDPSPPATPAGAPTAPSVPVPAVVGAPPQGAAPPSALPEAPRPLPTPPAPPVSRPSFPPMDPDVFAAFGAGTGPATPSPDRDSRSTLEFPPVEAPGAAGAGDPRGTSLERELPQPPDPFLAFQQPAPEVAALPEVPGAEARRTEGGAEGELLPSVPLPSGPPGPDAPRAPPVLFPVDPLVPRGGGLLADIPEAPPPEAPPGTPAAGADPAGQATLAIAHEYEQELRRKLEVQKLEKSFLQRRGPLVAVAAVLLVAALGLGGSFWWTRSRNQGETLDTAKAKALAAIAVDTREQYLVAVRALEQAQAMDEGDPAVLASLAYAHAMLYAEHGGDPAHRVAALAALTPKVREAAPAEALVVDSLTAAPEAAGAQRQRLLDAVVDRSLVHAHAGRLLLGDRRFDEALAHLKRATQLDPRQALALVALGDYYLAFEDWDAALEMMGRAEPLCRLNPRRVLGAALARLELGKELPEALASLEALTAAGGLTPELQVRAALLLGRALSAVGRHEDAVKSLQAGLAEVGAAMPFPFHLALGMAERAAGRMELAQRAYEEAVLLEPRSEEARAGLGRVLLARSRERELLERLKPERDQRQVALVRGIAWSRLGEPRKAREELKATQVGGKVPAEAAVYLALADASEEGQADKAVELLERIAAGRPRGRATVQVALARVYLQRNQVARARAQLEEAAREPQDWEASTLLGQLLLDGGAPEQALEPLQRALRHNGSHAPARHLLTRAFLAQGRTAEALQQVEAWTQDNPASDAAWRDAAQANLEAGKLAEAEAALRKLSPASDDAASFRMRARVHFARGDPAAGMAALERANRLDPHDAQTFCEIGHALVRQGNYELAPKAYRKAVEEDPGSACGRAGPYHAQPTARGKPPPREVVAGLLTRSTSAWERAFLLATQARLALEARDLKEAQAAAEAATAAAPASAPAWYALGEVRHRQKSEDQARAAFEKAAALDGSWAAAQLALADALLRQGGEALPRALASYELAAELDQSEPEAARARRAAAALRKQLR
jgi:tetratricopeptide (TPR) repeat protein